MLIHGRAFRGIKDNRLLFRDGTAVNAGTDEFISLKRAAEEIFEIIGWTPPEGIAYLADKPVGVKHRAADYTYAQSVTGWKPGHSFNDGLKKTIEWYEQNKDLNEVRQNLQALLNFR